MIRVYVESSISWSRPSDGIVGLKIEKDDLEPKLIFGRVKSCTECQAVLIGFVKALEYIKRTDEAIQLNTSCTFVYNALSNKWLLNWERKKYVGSKNKVIKNAREWHNLYLLIKGRNIEIRLGNSADLKDESLMRAKKYAGIFQSVRSSIKKI